MQSLCVYIYISTVIEIKRNFIKQFSTKIYLYLRLFVSELVVSDLFA